MGRERKREMKRSLCMVAIMACTVVLSVGCGKENTASSITDNNNVESNITADTETPEAETAEQVSIADEMAAVEAKSVEYEKRLSEAQTQAELNDIASEWYHLWDDELNSLWERATAEASDKHRDEMISGQKAWVERKEAAVDAAGDMVAGGSMEPMQRALTAKDYTRARAYLLACYVAEFEGDGYEIPADVQESISEVDMSLDKVFEKFQGQWIFDADRGACVGVEPSDTCDYGVPGSNWTVWVTGGDVFSDKDVVSFTDSTITFCVRDTYYKLRFSMANSVLLDYGSTPDADEGTIGY